MPSRKLTDLVTVVGPDDPDADTPITVRLVPDNGACYAPWNASTVAILEAMAGIDFTGKSVLDFGTGSGILAIVAAKLGARTQSVEIDQTVADCALANLAANNVADTVWYEWGDEPHFDIILANLGNAATALELLPRCDLIVTTAETKRERIGMEPGGRPIFKARAHDVAAAIVEAGRVPTLTEFADGWAVVVG